MKKATEFRLEANPRIPEALARLERALGEFQIEGPSTTVPLGLALLRDPEFRKGDYTTTYLESFLENGKLKHEEAS